jgi:phosphoglycerate dehydrogenase-like enzyme
LGFSSYRWSPPIAHRWLCRPTPIRGNHQKPLIGRTIVVIVLILDLLLTGQYQLVEGITVTWSRGRDLNRPTIAMTIGQRHYQRMLSPDAWNKLETFAHVIHHPGQDPAAKADLLALLPDADACITSWDVARLDADVIASAPRLKAMAHMGSSVARFVSDVLWEQGIHVTCTGPALARTVAETTLGLMIVGMKRIWPLGQHVRDGGWRESPYWPSRELGGKTVGIVGASNVGRQVMELLEPFAVRLLLYDPYVSDAEARRLRASKVELDDLVSRADIVSLHAPAKPETYHLLTAQQLSLMKDDALLINTARGSLIDEQALIAELSKGRFFAFLDVTDPEPPSTDSPLRQLENVVVTPHLAGCIEDCSRMGEMAVEELRRFFAGEPLLYRVTQAMLARIA